VLTRGVVYDPPGSRFTALPGGPGYFVAALVVLWQFT
jgi:hypothetical protein